MKKIIALALAAALLSPLALHSQDKRSLQAAEISFNSGERSFGKEDFKEAAKSFEIVIESIPRRIESRKHLAMRLDANIQLIEIYFNKEVNFKRACELIDEYEQTINEVRNSGVLKGRDLAKYLEQEQDNAKRKGRCKTLDSMDKDKDEFGKKFDKVFENE